MDAQTAAITAQTISMVTAEDDPIKLITELARARREAAAAKAINETRLQEVKDSPDYLATEATRWAWEERVTALTELIKARAVQTYEMTERETKSIWPGVKIQHKAMVTCTDGEAARKYALENVPALVKVDLEGLAKLAAKLADTPLALAFYEITEIPMATISQDLDKVLLAADLPF